MTVKLSDPGLSEVSWEQINDSTKIRLPVGDLQASSPGSRGFITIDSLHRAAESRIVLAPSHGFTAADVGKPLFGVQVYEDTNPQQFASWYISQVIDINNLRMLMQGAIRFPDFLIEGGAAYDPSAAGSGPFVYWDTSADRYVGTKPSDTSGDELLYVLSVSGGFVQAEILGWPPTAASIDDQSVIINATSPQFGAVGDGLTDDTQAIRSAILAASAPGKGVLYIPSGTYLCEGTQSAGAATTIATSFEIGSDPLRIVGDGIGKTILKASNNFPIRFFKNNTSLVSDFQIFGVTFQGNGLFDFSAGLAFAFEAFDGMMVEDCSFRNLTGGVIDGANSSSIQSQNFLLTHCRVSGEAVVTASVVHLHNCKGVTVTDNEFDRCCRVFDIETDSARSCEDMIFVSNRVTNGDRATRTGNESCLPVHVEIEDTSEAINGVVSNNTFINCHDDSVGSLSGGIMQFDHQGTDLLRWLPVIGDATANTLTLTSHGLANDTKIRLVDGGSTPGGTDNVTLYWVINQTANNFQISTSQGGAAVDFTSAGSGVVVLRVCTADNTTDTFTLPGHGLPNGNPVTFNTSGTMPTGLYKSTRYWVVTVTTDTFQISDTRGGTPINFTSNGTGLLTASSNCGLSNWTVSGNTIIGHRSNNTTQDYWVDNADHITITGNVSTGARHATARGIFLRDASHCVINGNSFDESYATGLLESTGCRKNIWTSNRVPSKTFSDLVTSVSTDANNVTGSTGY